MNSPASSATLETLSAEQRALAEVILSQVFAELRVNLSKVERELAEIDSKLAPLTKSVDSLTTNVDSLQDGLMSLQSRQNAVGYLGQRQMYGRDTSINGRAAFNGNKRDNFHIYAG